MSIKVENLTKIYGAQKAVNNISFEVSAGNIVGFLGPNGAGKSTTMKMLTTYILPTSGKAYIGGTEVTADPQLVKSKVGYLPESNPLYYDMYVREYLDFVADVHNLGAKKDARVSEMIELTGLTKEVKKKIGSLSKGYKQRVGIAQAMIHNPDVLILDEPTTGLDPNQIVEIRNLITTIGKEKTVLLSTHIMQEVEAMCNRVIIINNGQIVADNLIGEINQSTATAQTTLEVTFGGMIDEAILSQSFSHYQKAAAQYVYIFSTEDASTLRKQLMQWAVQQDVEIVSMNILTQSLEETFRKVTAN